VNLKINIHRTHFEKENNIYNAKNKESVVLPELHLDPSWNVLYMFGGDGNCCVET